LRQYKICLNPAKCVFGVTFGKRLSFIIYCGGIELDLAKIKAILDMQPAGLKAVILALVELGLFTILLRVSYMYHNQLPAY
jgi:hypothetical protein